MVAAACIALSGGFRLAAMDSEEIRQLIKTAAATGCDAFAGEPGARERYVDFYDDAVKLQGYPPGIEGKEGARAFYYGFFDAFDDGRVEVEEILVEGDTAAIRFRLTGTHAGELLGVPASGNPVDVTGQSFIRVRDGKFVERIQQMDGVALLQGAIPAPA